MSGAIALTKQNNDFPARGLCSVHRRPFESCFLIQNMTVSAPHSCPDPALGAGGRAFGTACSCWEKKKYQGEEFSCTLDSALGQNEEKEGQAPET